jgi:UrcA family protein
MNQEIHMYANAAVTRARILLGATTFICTLFAANINAKDKIVTESVRVSPQGLDLSQPADARTFYTRLENAAWVVCTRGTRVDLLPADDKLGCYQKALGDAVHASNKALVTQIYLATHTLQEAAAHGIEVPAQVAAK